MRRVEAPLPFLRKRGRHYKRGLRGVILHGQGQSKRTFLFLRLRKRRSEENCATSLVERRRRNRDFENLAPANAKRRFLRRGAHAVPQEQHIFWLRSCIGKRPRGRSGRGFAWPGHIETHFSLLAKTGKTRHETRAKEAKVDRPEAESGIRMPLSCLRRKFPSRLFAA